MKKLLFFCRKQSKSFYSPCQGCQLPQWTDFRSCYMKSLQEPKFKWFLWVSSKLGTYREWWIVFTIPGPHFLVFPRNTPFFFFFNSKGRCLFRVYYEPLTSNNTNCEVQARSLARSVEIGVGRQWSKREPPPPLRDSSWSLQMRVVCFGDKTGTICQEEEGACFPWFLRMFAMCVRM